jgi:toxin ParE1/3/4
MDYKVIWTEPAHLDLKELVAYIADDDPEAAERVGNDILEHVEILGTFPYIGPAYPRKSKGDRREIVCGNYRIFYRVQEDAKIVEILTIWHGARGTPPLL